MDPIKDIIKKVRETILRYGMTNQGEKIIVAVSGGPDSICLLDILNLLSDELKIILVVAHYNHGLREAEDDSETQLVKDLAERIKIPFVSEKSSHLKSGSPSIEEKAREARYDFLERIREDYDAQKIAVGHTLADQAETIIMRLLRGSGPSGLAGIPPVRDNRIIRPLIEIKREEIMAYLDARGLTYALDSSNKDKKYLRNRIRFELMPMMLEYQPRLIENLKNLSNILRDEGLFMELLAKDWIEKEAKREAKGHISVPISSFIGLPMPLRNRVTRCILKEISGHLRRIEYDHILSVSELADSDKPQTMLDLPNGITIRKVYDRLVFMSGTRRAFQGFHYSINGPGSFHIEAIDRTIILDKIRGGINDVNVASAFEAYLDAEKIKYPMILRNSRPGDKFIPLGMNGHKKVKDFFIDLKVPSEIRAATPILTSEDRIAWVCGFRIAEDFKVTLQTKKIVRVTIS